MALSTTAKIVNFYSTYVYELSSVQPIGSTMVFLEFLSLHRNNTLTLLACAQHRYRATGIPSTEDTVNFYIRNIVCALSAQWLTLGYTHFDVGTKLIIDVVTNSTQN